MHKLTGSQERYGRQKCAHLYACHTPLIWISYPGKCVLLWETFHISSLLLSEGWFLSFPLLIPQTHRQKWINKEKGMVFRSNLHHFHSHDEKFRNQRTKDGVLEFFLFGDCSKYWMTRNVSFCPVDTWSLLVIGCGEGDLQRPHEYYINAIVRMLALFVFQENKGQLLSYWYESYRCGRDFPTLCATVISETKWENLVFSLDFLSLLQS